VSWSVIPRRYGAGGPSPVTVSFVRRKGAEYPHLKVSFDASFSPLPKLKTPVSLAIGEGDDRGWLRVAFGAPSPIAKVGRLGKNCVQIDFGLMPQFARADGRYPALDVKEHDGALLIRLPDDLTGDATDTRPAPVAAPQTTSTPIPTPADLQPAAVEEPDPPPARTNRRRRAKALFRLKDLRVDQIGNELTLKGPGGETPISESAAKCIEILGRAAPNPVGSRFLRGRIYPGHRPERTEERFAVMFRDLQRAGNIVGIAIEDHPGVGYSLAVL